MKYSVVIRVDAEHDGHPDEESLSVRLPFVGEAKTLRHAITAALKAAPEQFEVDVIEGEESRS